MLVCVVASHDNNQLWIPDQPLVPIRYRSGLAVLASSVAVAASGAMAIGAAAIAAFAIRRLAVGKEKFDRMEIDELTIRRIRVIEPVDEGASRGRRE
jgi:hypothetical protein